MKYCKKCGAEINENSKFCVKCGTEIEESIQSGNDLKNEESKNKNEDYEAMDEFEDDDYEEDYDDSYDNEKSNTSKSKKIIIILSVLAALAIFTVGSLFAFKKYKELYGTPVKSLKVISLDVTKYPNVKLTLKADNYKNDLNVENLTVKENDAFQSDLILNKSEDGEYSLSYESNEKSSSQDINVKIAYLEDGKEESVDTNYSVPKQNEDTTQTSKKVNNNSVNTYDENEELVKKSIDKYEESYIEMVHAKDTYYIKDAIDLSSGLLKEFENNMENFSKQKIDEYLRSYEVEKINKVNDNEYEVTVKEKFNIDYGEKHESKNEDFRNIYVVSKTSSGFKVHHIKKINKL